MLPLGALRKQVRLQKLRPFCSFASLSYWEEKRSNREQQAHWNDVLSPRRDRIRHGVQDLDPDGRCSDEQRRALIEIVQLGQARRWKEALLLFGTLPETQRNAKLHNAALVACAKSLQMTQACLVFDNIPVKSLPDYNTLIMMYGRLRRITEVENVFAKMKQRGLEPSTTTFGCLINAYGMVWNVDAALRTFDEMRAAGMPCTATTYACVLGACAKAGAKEQAAQIMSQMQAACVEPNLGHFTSLIVACARSKDEARACEAFTEMRRRCIQPDQVAYTALMGCFDAVEKAEALLAEMRAGCLTPDIHAQNQLLQVALQGKRLQRCREIFLEMEAAGTVENEQTRLRRQQLQQMEEEAKAQRFAAAAATPLPPGWHERVDPVSGQTYYWSQADPNGTTTWERPSAL